MVRIRYILLYSVSLLLTQFSSLNKVVVVNAFSYSGKIGIHIPGVPPHVSFSERRTRKNKSDGSSPSPHFLQSPRKCVTLILHAKITSDTSNNFPDSPSYFFMEHGDAFDEHVSGDGEGDGENGYDDYLLPRNDNDHEGNFGEDGDEDENGDNDNGDHEDDEYFDDDTLEDEIDELDLALRMQTITDEEALLACRAYLQRRNKLNPTSTANSNYYPTPGPGYYGSESASVSGSNNPQQQQGGWIQARIRRQKLQNSLLSMNQQDGNTTSTSNSGYEYGPGYFWEDPKELQYLRTGRPRMSFGEGKTNGAQRSRQVDELPDADVEFANFNAQFMRGGGGGGGGGSYSGGERESYSDDGDNEDDGGGQDLLDSGEEEGIFTSFPSYPPQSHVRRSKAKKDLFQDPEWKAKWYLARWGGEEEKKAMLASRKVKKMGTLIEQIPSDILTSPQLAALSDDEIEDAIKTYIVANERRSKSHKRRIRDRDRRRMLWRNLRQDDASSDAKTVDDEEKDDRVDKSPTSGISSSSIPTLDAFMMQSEESNKEALKEQQRKRSERAAKAYQTRIKNAAKKQLKQSSLPTSSKKATRKTIETLRKTYNGGEEVSDAMDRIQEALDSATKPSVTDVQLILRPKRLTRRKEILREILFTCFGLVGRCIPVLDESSRDELEEYYRHASLSSVEEAEKKYVTRSTVVEVGAFAIFKLQQATEQAE